MPAPNRISVRLLDMLASAWPSPVAERRARLGVPGTDEYGRAYALDQFLHKVRFGSLLGPDQPSLIDCDVLEIGCGHGGISCYLASIGARKVVGIDLDTIHTRFGTELAERFAAASGRPLPVEFCSMDASAMTFADESFDVVVAENVFEHFERPENVLAESFRVLRPGGSLVVPVFSSIYSKYGLHLKRGLRLPWANLVFSERTIVEVMQRRVQRDSTLVASYPGSVGTAASKVRDLRRHRDLNDITYSSFRTMAERTGFEVVRFRVYPTVGGRVLRTVAPPAWVALSDVLSTGAGAVLRKPGVP